MSDYPRGLSPPRGAHAPRQSRGGAVTPKTGPHDLKPPGLMKQRSPSVAHGLVAFSPHEDDVNTPRRRSFDPMRVSLVCEACGKHLEPNSTWHFWSDSVYCSTSCKAKRETKSATVRTRARQKAPAC